MTLPRMYLVHPTSFSKQKLTIVAQKAEMKRKLATVTPEIYNGLDLIVDSPEFNQVGVGSG